MMKRSRQEGEEEEEKESSVCMCGGDCANSPPYSPPSPPPRPSTPPQCATTRRGSNKKFCDHEDGESDVDPVLHWQRRDALLNAQEFLCKDARDSAERGAQLARDKLQEIQFARFALALEGQTLGINAWDTRNPVSDAIVDELNEIHEFREKVLRVDHYEEQWGVPKLKKSKL